MSVLLMIGNHPRHFHMARAVASSGLLNGLVVETREHFVPQPPAELAPATADLFRRHFRERDETEARHFGADEGALDGMNPPGIDRLNVSLEELNGPKVQDFITRLQPRLLLSYGVHKLSEETLSRAKGMRWNIHGGLSPWYRGVVTLFWPSYFLEPQMTGMTLHDLTQDIDGGDVVHQAAAPLIAGDGIHDLACRAVDSLARDLPKLLQRMLTDDLKPARPQGTSGRIWRARDWRPEHLHPIYDHYENRIVDHCLAGRMSCETPNLFRQF